MNLKNKLVEEYSLVKDVVEEIKTLPEKHPGLVAVTIFNVGILLVCIIILLLTVGRVADLKNIPMPNQKLYQTLATNSMVYKVDSDKMYEIYQYVDTFSTIWSVDPVFIISFIEVCSRFNSKKVTQGGAVGLIPVIPAMHSKSYSDMIDPKKNIAYGCQMFSYLLSNHTMKDALSMYFRGNLYDSESAALVNAVLTVYESHKK